MDKISVFDKDFNLHILVVNTLEDKVCPYAIPDGRITKLVTSYHSIQRDLLETQEMITYLQSIPTIPIVVKTSMFKAFIIQYAKCFTQAWGRNMTLKADDVYKGQTKLLDIHNEVIQMRNNYIAHAGRGKYEYGAMVIYLNPDLENPSIHRIFYTDLKFMDHSLNLPDYERICKHSLEYVKFKLEELQPSYNSEVGAMELQDLYSMSKTPIRKDYQVMYYENMMGAQEPDKVKIKRGAKKRK